MRCRRLLSAALLALLPLMAQAPSTPPAVAAAWPDVRKVLDREAATPSELDSGAGAAYRAFQLAAVRWVEGHLAQGGAWEALPEAFAAQLPPKACEGLDREPPSLHLLPLTAWPAWRMLKLDCPVPCGSTEAVLVFERVGNRWHLRMADLWPDLEVDSLKSARENVTALFRQTAQGPRLVVGDTPPWCTSCWSSLRVRVLAPAETPESRRVVQAREASAYRCNEPPFQMRFRKNAVEVRFTTMGKDPANPMQSTRWTIPLN